MKDCVKFATENPICFLAEIDGGQARVRALLLAYADGSGFYFVLWSQKDITKQLKQDIKVAVCFFNNAANPAAWKQMRVTG